MRAAAFLLLALAAAFPVFGQTRQAPAAFDSVAAHHVYLEGEFPTAIQMLEPLLKRKDLSHGDSVFIFKHLGVMFAASEVTREKGKYYMYKLIEAEPLSNILDMYASDMIYMIFKNVKDEFEASRLRMARAQQWLGRDGKGTNGPAAKTPRRSSHHLLYWLGGAGVAAAVGVGMLVYLENEEPSQPDPIVTKKVYGIEE